MNGKQKEKTVKNGQTELSYWIHIESLRKATKEKRRNVKDGNLEATVYVPKRNKKAHKKGSNRDSERISEIYYFPKIILSDRARLV